MLSIIVSTYNMAADLDHCVRTTLSGCAKDVLRHLEIIIVDDGSTDETATVVASLMRDFPDTVRSLRKSNGHYGSCINAALPQVRGEYVRLLDADDALRPSALEELVNFCSDMDVPWEDVILTDAECVVDGIISEAVKIKLDLPLTQGTYFFADVADKLAGVEMYHITYRTELLRSISYRQTEGIAYTDTEWAVLPMLHAMTVAWLPVTLYRYTYSRPGQSVSADVMRLSFADMQSVMLSICNRYESLPSDDLHYAWLTEKLRRKLRAFYYDAIVKHIYTAADIRSFESSQHLSAPSAYALSSTCELHPRYPLRFVAQWRATGTLHLRPWQWLRLRLLQVAARI